MPEKPCSKCGIVKSLTEFHRNRRNKDGHHSDCKECKTATHREWRKKNRDVANASTRAWEQMHPERKHRARADYRARHPEKRLAHEAIARAQRLGKMTRPENCEGCGERIDGLHAHHDDYSRRLDVRWLCPQCHQDVHRLEKVGAEGERDG